MVMIDIFGIVSFAGFDKFDELNLKFFVITFLKIAAVIKV